MADEASTNVRAPERQRVETKIERRYAHFHRVLGELLVRLGEREQTFWLEGERHRIVDAIEANEYAKAVYVVPDLRPYEDDLAELAEVRADALALMGASEPTQALLTPKVCRGVARARILSNTAFASRARARSDVLNRFAARRDAAVAAAETFAGYSDRQAKLEEIERELDALEAGLRALRSTNAVELREHYRYQRFMCHVHYPAPREFDQLYVGDVGIILQGRDAEVQRHRPKRRKHRRTPGIEPLAIIGPYTFYEEHAWREARSRA